MVVFHTSERNDSLLNGLTTEDTESTEEELKKFFSVSSVLCGEKTRKRICSLEARGMKRNADIGLFTDPSSFKIDGLILRVILNTVQKHIRAKCSLP
jgi:hypothetical protein